MNVVGFLVSFSAVEPYVIGFFVGFGFGLAGVVLSQGDFVFVIKFGSVVTCQGVDDHEPETGEKNRIFMCEEENVKSFFKTY